MDSDFFHGQGFLSDFKSSKYQSLQEKLQHSNNSEFWLNKIKNNMKHDLEVTAALKGAGWRVLRFWSSDVLHDTDGCLTVIKEAIYDSELEEKD